MAVSHYGSSLSVCREPSGGLRPAVRNTNLEYDLENNCFARSILELCVTEKLVEKIVGSRKEDVVEGMFVESLDEDIVDVSLEQFSIDEIVEDIVPEHYRLIPHTSYTVLKKVMDTFMTSKRRTRDVENIDTYIRDRPKSDCARIDSLYRVRAGIKSHIAVQDNDQYWAEQEKLFPYLKQMHEEEAASLEKSSEKSKNSR